MTGIMSLIWGGLTAFGTFQIATAAEPSNWKELVSLIAPDTSAYNPTKYSQGNVLKKIGNDSYFKIFNNQKNLVKYANQRKYPASPATPGSYWAMGQNQLKSALTPSAVSATKGFAYNFSTYIIPPQFGGDEYSGLYNLWSVQGMTKMGNYFYLFKTNGSNGSIVRINQQIAEVEASDGYALSLIATSLMTASNCKGSYNEFPCSALKKYPQYIQFGQSFPLSGAHGGSLASDGQNLWVTLEPNDDPNGNPNSVQRLIKFDPNSLRATKEYSYKMSNTFDVGQKPYTQNYMIKNIAFTAPGKFVGFWEAAKRYTFFIGTVNEQTNQVSIQAAPNIFSKRIGWAIQNFACNRATQQLYLVADGVIASFPVSLLTAKITKDSWRYVRYSQLDTDRESEGLSFDDDGSNMYLFLFQRAEILKAPTNANLPFDYNVSLGARQESIMWLLNNKFAAGTNAQNVTTYRPDNSVNRGAMAQFMYNVSGQPAFLPTSEERNRFKDLSGLNAERKFAIQWLVHNGITQGCNTAGDKYCPNNAVNRGSMAQFLARLADVTFTAYEISAFPDVFSGTEAKTITYKNGSKITKTKVKPVDVDRVTAINWLASVQVTAGSQADINGVTTYRPQDKVNRGAMAEFLQRWATSPTISHPFQAGA
jgi:hypothetical protein